MDARVIGMGQPAAGDDGVGFAVLAELRRRGTPPGVKLFEATEATGLADLLETTASVIVVDAIASTDPPGKVLELPPEHVDSPRLQFVSTHGIGLVETIALARLVAPASIAPSVWIVGVTIVRPHRYGYGLSPAVARAVPRAAKAVLTRIRG